MKTLKEGTKAPQFTSVDQNGEKISLKDFMGKKVVIYFYPKDDTPTCTTQACNLRDNYSLLVKQGFVVIGISVDSVKSHKKFETKYTLPFTLIADEDKKIVEKYGVWGEKLFMGKTIIGTHRTTFLIDETGKIKKIIRKPKNKIHTEEILNAWNEIE
jgi:peroxiredoxin Q/BCP